MNNPENPSPYNLGRGARLNMVFEILMELAETGKGLDQIVGGRFKHLGDRLQRRDRRDIETRLRSIMMHYARLVWWIKRTNLDPSMRILVLADLVLNDRADLNHLQTLCNGAKNRMESLRKDEIQGLKKMMGQDINQTEMSEATRHECPEWAWAGLSRRFGSELEKSLGSFFGKPSTDLRVNTLKSDLETAQAELANQGIKTEPGHLSGLCLKIQDGGGPLISETKAFQNGHVEIQDEGSQLVAQIVSAENAKQVLDFCAGAGGKTLAIAAQMNNKGHLVAADVHSKRLQRARVRLKRAGVENTERRVLEFPHDKWLKKNKAKFDRVLVDAPCSGTGTWRRQPEAKWNRDESDLVELMALQAKILDTAEKMVKSGGQMIYATCSLMPEENEDQMTAFLERNKDFSIQPIEGLKEELGQNGKEHLVLTPDQHGCDGFFCCVLKRQ